MIIDNPVNVGFSYANGGKNNLQFTT